MVGACGWRPRRRILKRPGDVTPRRYFGIDSSPFYSKREEVSDGWLIVFGYYSLSGKSMYVHV